METVCQIKFTSFAFFNNTSGQFGTLTCLIILVNGQTKHLTKDNPPDDHDGRYSMPEALGSIEDIFDLEELDEPLVAGQMTSFNSYLSFVYLVFSSPA